MADDDDFWGGVSQDRTTTPSRAETEKSPSPVDYLSAVPDARVASSLHSTPTASPPPDRKEEVAPSDEYDSGSFISSEPESSSSPSSEQSNDEDDARTTDTGHGPSLDSKDTAMMASVSAEQLLTPAREPSPKPKVAKKKRAVRKKLAVPGATAALSSRVPAARLEEHIVRQMPDEPKRLKEALGVALREKAALSRVVRRQELELGRSWERKRDSPGAQRQDEEIRVLKESLRLGREKRNHQERVLRERNDALQKALRRLAQTDALLAAKGLKRRRRPEGPALRNQLQEKTEELEALTRKLELTEKNYRHQMSIEVQRHKDTAKRLLLAQTGLEQAASHKKNVGKISRQKKPKRLLNDPFVAVKPVEAPPSVPPTAPPTPPPATPPPPPAPEEVAPDVKRQATPPRATQPEERAERRESAPREWEASKPSSPPVRHSRFPELTTSLSNVAPKEEQDEILASLTRKQQPQGKLPDVELPWDSKPSSRLGTSRHSYSLRGSSPAVVPPKPASVPPPKLDMDELFGPRVTAAVSMSAEPKARPPPIRKSKMDELFGPKLGAAPRTAEKKNDFPWEKISP